MATDLEARLRAAGVLLDGYEPRRPWRRALPKSSGGVRRLTIPASPDRAVQRAVLDALPAAALAERPEVHGYVRGRSVATAIRHLLSVVGRRRWLEVVQVDVADLFDTLDHRRLLEAVAARWPDPTLLELVPGWCRAYGRGARGVGQGGPLSPWLANVYLARWVDPAIAAVADAGWVRYADDVTVATARRGGGSQVLLALDAAARAAGLALASHKVHVCTPAQPLGLRVLGVSLQVVRADGGYRLTAGPGAVHSGRRRGWPPADLSWERMAEVGPWRFDGGR